MNDIDKAIKATQELKEATSEAHKAVQDLKEHRRLLLNLIDTIKSGKDEIIAAYVGNELGKLSTSLRRFQLDCEARLTRRFDDFIQKPFDDLARLLADLKKATEENNMDREMIRKAVGNPLFRDQNPLRRINKT